MPQRNSPLASLLTITFLTVLAFAIAGYHPFVEDGGVYAAGIERLLNPALFPTWTAFVTEHLRFSLFAPLVAALVRLTHLPLTWTLLLLYVFSIWLTLYAAWLLAVRLTESTTARLAAVTLLACWLTLPIAGTSLMLMDPYVTARSFTTPLTLFALAWALDALAGRRTAWLFCTLAIAAATLLHPLMAGYALAAVLCLAAVHTKKLWPPLSLLSLALSTAAILQANAPLESATYLRIALTRYYWFLSQWHWYELLGLIAPLAILLALANLGAPSFAPLLHAKGGVRSADNLRSSTTNLAASTAQAAILLGAIALTIALLFAHESYPTHLVARLQPLRAFQIVYELMILLLGAWLGRNILKQHPWRWAIFLALLAPPMFYAQRSTFPNSAHIEWPNAKPANPWQQAFLWVRANTPTNALFALDAHYITEGKHEDAQCFRAIAQRSALPDYSKDGGEASITPALTSQWAIGQAAQTNLETEPDNTREARLKPLGVTWAVLEATSPTAWSCPYQNPTVKVCRLP